MTTITNANGIFNLWVKLTNGNVDNILPGAQIVPNIMANGNYHISSNQLIAGLPLGPAANVVVTNLGPQTIVFICPANNALNFILFPGNQNNLANFAYNAFVI